MTGRTALIAVLAAAVAACSGAPAAPGQPASPSAGPATAAPTTLSATTAPWQLPAPVSRPVAVTRGAVVLLLGGLVTGDVSTGSVVRVDLSAGTAATAGSLANPVHDAAGAALAGSVFVFGGGTATSVATVQEWGPSGGRVAGALPEPRSDLASVTVGHTAFVLGGYTGTALSPSVLATTDGVQFRTAGTLAQPVRYPAVAALHGQVWVVGGLLSTSESGTTQTDDIQRFDPSTGRTTVVGHLPLALAHASAFALDGAIYVAGGQADGGPQTGIYRVDPATGAVTVAGQLPQPRSDAGVAVAAGHAWLLGGEQSSPTAPLSSVVELTPGG